MKRLLLALLLVQCLAVHAVEVVTSGKGRNYQEAIEAAKIDAIDRVNGVWVHGDAHVRDNMFQEKITQYNGGVIASYEVMQWDGKMAIIKADVVPRASNGMTTNSATITSNMKQELGSRKANDIQKAEAVRVIDSRTRALSFKTELMQFESMGDKTKVTLIGTISYQDKWANDYVDLKKLGGDIPLNSFYSPMTATVEGRSGYSVRTSAEVHVKPETALYWFTPNSVVVDVKQKSKTRLTFIAETDKIIASDNFVITFN